jgi:hypothetical protein
MEYREGLLNSTGSLSAMLRPAFLLVEGMYTSEKCWTGFAEIERSRLTKEKTLFVIVMDPFLFSFPMKSSGFRKEEELEAKNQKI